MALRKRDKKGYPQFVGRIIEWKNNDLENGKKFLVRVAGFDYHIGISFVNVYDSKDIFTCYNGPLSPEGMSKNCDYDKAFEYALKVLRSNSMYDVQEMYKASGGRCGNGIMASCPFGM